MGDRMRPFDELARFWNDMRSRRPHGVWAWPLAAAAGGALFVLAGAGAAERPAEANVNRVVAAAPVPADCRDQTWPFLSDACLRGRQANQVRMIRHDPAMETAAIGATQWAPRGAPPTSRQTPTRHKQATHDPNRTATSRAGRRGRNAAQERTYAIPADAFSSYGSARR